MFVDAEALQGSQKLGIPVRVIRKVKLSVPYDGSNKRKEMYVYCGWYKVHRHLSTMQLLLHCGPQSWLSPRPLAYHSRHTCCSVGMAGCLLISYCLIIASSFE